MPMQPEIAPSGISVGVNTDPNTGAMLRDRFHQLRGREFEQMRGTGMDQRIAAEFLRDRGAPMTAQNLAIANEYLSGGGLDRFAQQQTTEDEIASQALAAEAGGAGGGAGPDSVAPPQAPPSVTGPVPPAAGGPNAPPMGGLPLVLPGYRMTPEGAVDAGSPAANRSLTRTGIDAITGELMPDSEVVGVNPAQGPFVEGPARQPQLTAVPGADVIDAEVVPQTPQLPPPPKQIASDAEAQARAGAAIPRGEAPEDRPIATDDVVPKSAPSEKPRAGAIEMSGKGPNGEALYKSGGKWTARGPDGNWVKQSSRTALIKALRGLR